MSKVWPATTDATPQPSLVSRLRTALERREFVLHYQPVVELLSLGGGGSVSAADARIVGVEALIRLQDQVEGLIEPTEFLSLAEGSGLIESMGDWVLGEACARSRAWEDSGRRLDVAFNLSLRQFWEPDLADKVRAAIAASGADPERLTAEISEAAAMADPSRTDRVMGELSEAGIRIAIDEYGAGESSFAQLRDMPLDLVKIDRSLTTRLPGDEAAAGRVDSLLGRLEELSVRTLAVGVETEEQLAFLVERGCFFGQGYLFSRPLPLAEIDALLAGRSSEGNPESPAR